MHGVQFATLRLIVLALAVFSQIYLFLAARQAILSLQGSAAFKSLAIGIIGTAITLLFACNGYILSRPIPWADLPDAAQIGLFYPPAIWSFGSIFSALFLAVIQGGRWLGKRTVHWYAKQAGRREAHPANPDRRLFLRAGIGGVVAAPLTVAGYGAVYAAHAYEICAVDLPFGRAISVVQISDIHAGLYMTRAEMARYADQIGELKPDLFVMTGDFISNALAFLPGCLGEMARVRARWGTFAVLGNHEHWYGSLAKIQPLFQQYGIPLLQNAHQVIETERGAFAVAGIDDLVAGQPDLAGALRGLDDGIPTLLLSHRPEVFPQAAAYGIPLTLSGHYHGGQIKVNLPGGGAVGLAHLRTPYPEGLYRIKASHLYVNRGIGTTFTPVRLNARPEITLFHLT